MTTAPVFPAIEAGPRVITTPLGPIELALAGDPAGVPVLAVHGGMGGWDQARLLAETALAGVSGVRLILPSRPGYLGTPLGRFTTPEEQARLLRALLEALGLEKVLILAISAGGVPALHLARQAPEACRGVILVSAATGRMTSPLRYRFGLALLRALAARGWLPQRAPDVERSARRLLPEAEARRAALADPDFRRRLEAFSRISRDRLGERLAGTQADMAALARAADVPGREIAVPLLALHGDADPVVPLAQARRLTAEAGRARLKTLAGGGHYALFTHAREMAAEVADFIAAL